MNSDLAVVCSNCGGFLQARVATLDFFDTIWQLIESPRRAMRKIALSMHKNYSVLLSGLYGINLAFFFMWLFSLGEEFDNVLYLMFTAFLIGPPAGLIHLGLVGAFGVAVGKVFGAVLRFIDVFAAAAYATVPLVFALVFVLPIEILTFGLYLFSDNPSPLVIKPVSYILFLILDGIASFWSFSLLVIGIQTVAGLNFWKSILFVGFSVGLPFLLLYTIVALSL